MNEIRLQSGLGNIEGAGRPDLHMVGYACLARIIKIHHKRYTADVCLVRTNDLIMSIPRNEGKFACRIATPYAHFNPDTNKSSGVMESLQEGQIVVVGYLENVKNEPWILGSFHWTMEPNQNILPSQYPITSSDLREYGKYLRVYPSQDYFRLDGGGNIEFALHGKSFLKIDEDLSDTDGGTDFEDLLEKDKFTGTTRTMEDTNYHNPKSMLFVHRDNWDDSATKWTKFFLDGSGLFRITRDNRDETLTFSEWHKNGSWRVKRQLDNSLLDAGQKNTEIKLSRNGAFSIMRKQRSTEGGSASNETTSISLPDDGSLNASRSCMNSSSGGAAESVVSSVKITGNNEITVSRKFQGGSESKNTIVTINANNDLMVTIDVAASGASEQKVSINCSAVGFVDIYGKHGVTIRSDSGSYSV